MTEGQAAIIRECFAKNLKYAIAAQRAGVKKNVASCAYTRLKRGGCVGGGRYKRTPSDARPEALTPELVGALQELFEASKARLARASELLAEPALVDERLAACLRLLKIARGNLADAFGEFRVRNALATGAIAKAVAADGKSASDSPSGFGQVPAPSKP